MESLLCDEVLLMSPLIDHDKLHANEVCNANCHCSLTSSFYTTLEDNEAFGNFMDKEMSYMPERGYSELVQSNSWIGSVRFKAIQWLIISQSRLNLSHETVFCAANYLDRFISLNQCQDWKHWMFELLAIACLSVASKFNETIFHSLHEIQMEGLEHFFESSLIQRMELSLLKALEWRLAPTTSYSYFELLTRSTGSPNYKHLLLVGELTARLTQLLLSALLDSKFLVFRPCVIAMSALEHISKELFSSTNHAYFSALIPQEEKDDLNKCCMMMEECNFTPRSSIYSCPSSPVTVLATQEYDFYDFQVDLSPLNMRREEIDLGSRKRRKREEQQYCV